jgi:hypothetical protein
MLRHEAEIQLQQLFNYLTSLGVMTIAPLVIARTIGGDLKE